MNKTILVLIAFIVAGSTVLAQDVSLSGVVTSGGAGINGVYVTLKNHPHLSAVTDASGAFTIGGSLPIVTGRSGSTTEPIPFVSGTTLHVPALSKGTLLNIGLFTLSGIQIATSEIPVKTAGDVAIPLAERAAGIRCVTLTVGSSLTYHLVLPSGLSHATMYMQGVSKVNTRTTAAVAGDSLVLVGRGYRTALVALEGYKQTGIQASLTASSPWQPQGALVHDKGMVKILAAGHDFEMGQDRVYTVVDEDVYSEQPVHTVYFTSNFWMDTTEVTQKEYDALMKKWFPGYVVSTMRTAMFGIGDAIPAYYFYWDEAVLFCNAKSKEEGLDTVYRYGGIDGTPGMLCSFSIDVPVTADFSKNGYRLPTEAEWEYACRGGTNTDYYWGKNYDDYRDGGIDTAEISRFAVWEANSGCKGKGAAGFGIHAVATGLPNAYGLYDMIGNMSELTHDEESFSYDYGSVTDPSGPSKGTPTHMVRGGNWMNGCLYLRSGSRNLHYGEYPFYCVGFRTVRRAQ